jgi:hypothetical protein
MEKKTPNQNEIDRVMDKVDEFDSQAVTSTKDLGKLMHPADISGNVHGRGKAKKGKKSK